MSKPRLKAQVSGVDPSLTVQASPKQWFRAEAIRKCEVSYLLDAKFHSLEYWWNRFCVDHIPLEELETIAQAGQWAAKRQQYHIDCENDVIRHAKLRVLKDQIRQIETLDKVAGDILEQMASIETKDGKVWKVPAKSFEGLVGSLVKVFSLKDALSKAVLPTAETPNVIDIEPEAELDQTELRAIAMKILEEKQAKRLSLAKGKQGDNGNGSTEDDASSSGEEDQD